MGKLIVSAGSAMVVLMLASCQLEEPVIPVEETYTRAFVKQFGVIDPEQDWNMATRGSVTVSSPSSAEVEVYVKDNGKYYLTAVCDDLAGSKTIEFDIPRGSEELLVMQGEKSYNVKNGGNIDFSENTGGEKMQQELTFRMPMA